MSRNIVLPHSPGVNQAAVVHVAREAKAWKLARHYGVRLDLMKAWLSGAQPMPRMLYELLALNVRCELPETCGLFAGWSVVDGERFTGPNLEKPGGLHWSDIDQLPDYRRASSLASRQSDLIERLTRERDFYKRQCQLETKYAVMLRLLEDGPPAGTESL